MAPGQQRPLFVIEADEYDTAFFDKRSKFVHYRPPHGGAEQPGVDHADIFPIWRPLSGSFNTCCAPCPPLGAWSATVWQEALARVLHEGCWSQVRSFGSAVSDFTAQGPHHAFAVLHAGQVVGQVQWGLSGEHNQLNALAAIAAAEHVGVAPAAACAALADFQNVRRRMELRGTVAGIALYDDFAHHPTAIRTTLDGLRQQIGQQKRILAVFEPRSNTMKLGTMKAQLPWALKEADLAFCHTAGLDWDAAQALEPLGAAGLTADNIATLVQQVMAAVQPNDTIVCMSNGGFGGVHTQLLAALAEKFSAQ